MSRLVLARFGGLSEALALLVAHGPDALLDAEGIELYARALLEGHATIRPEERAAYGDAAAWAAWEALRATHGARLRAMVATETARALAENDQRVAATTPQGAGAMGGDWFAEDGR